MVTIAYVEHAQNLVNPLLPPLDLLLVILGVKYLNERISFGVCLDHPFNVIRCAGNTPLFHPIDKCQSVDGMGAPFQIRDCRLYQLAQAVGILPLDPEPEDFTDFDAVFGQPNEIVVIDQLVLTISLVSVRPWLLMDIRRNTSPL